MNQARKKVLYVITKATWGGAQKYVYDLATHLPKEFEPIVAYGVAGKLSDDLERAGIQTRHIASMQRDVALFSDISSFFEIRKCMRELRPAVVHLNSSKASALGALAARISSIPTILFTVHGWPFKESRNALARVGIYLISWFTALLSTTAIVVSKSDEDKGKHMWFVGDKILYLPIGIDPITFTPREEAWKAMCSYATIDIPKDAIRIVSIAELTPNKGIGYALEAMAQLKTKVHYVYFIISDGEERERLEKKAHNLGIADTVVFTGFIPNAARYLRAFDVFLLPSIKEGMPHVLLEAASANLRIISTNVVDPLFLARFQDVIKIGPRDPSAIASAVLAAREPSPAPSPKDMTDVSPAPAREKTFALYR